jgi:glycosyltransferase involved in cell wall biosynthesis
LFTPGRPDEIAAAIRQLAGDRQLRRRLGKAGREKVLAEYDADVSAEQLLTCFRELQAG